MKISRDSVLLQAFQGTNTKVPVWFMRQAGRYLPEYQAIRKTRSLDEMFRDPNIVADVTCLPIDILNVDAAILFADILTLPSALGFKITFDKDKGPIIANPVDSQADIEKIQSFEGLSYLKTAIRQINTKLPDNTPLIGFAGGPFTVLCYLVEGGSSANYSKTLNLIHSNEDMFHALMKKLTQGTIEYLNFQKESGIQVFQIFDTWAGLLSPNDYQYCVLPYVQEIFKSINLPSIYYVKNSSHILSLMDLSEADFLSVCQTVNFEDNQVLAKTDKGVQGNLFTGFLYAEDDVLEKEANRMLKSAQRFKKYIFNLSHGVLPDVNPEKLKLIVKTVNSFGVQRKI